MKTSEYENPFGIKTNENYEYIITLGSQLASKKTFKTKEEAEKYIEEKPWDLLAILAIATAETTFRTIYESKEESKVKGV